MAKKDARTADQQKQGEKLRKEGAKWLGRVEAAGKLEKQWMDDAEKAVKAFTGEVSSRDYSSSTTLGTTYDFNILFANVETIVPAVINSPPQPDIRRRFNDEDSAAKDVAQIIERAIKIQVDDGKLQVELEGEAQDAFLAGRGVIRLRFKSDIVKDTADELESAAGGTGDGEYSKDGGSLAVDEGRRQMGDDAAGPNAGDVPGGAAASERLANEQIAFEAVSWRDYRHGPAKRWCDRPWDAFRFSVPREDEETAFDIGSIGIQTSDDEKRERGESDSDLTGWEIWCKSERKVYFIGDDGVILKTVDDPLGLTDFFCIATPVQPIELTGRLMPVNPFSVYSKLADELDLTTKRINIITNKMRVKGWYPGSQADMAAMVAADDDDFVPIADTDIWAANGGLQGAVAFWPIEKYVMVLRELYAARDQTKQAIYEITGISDIVRGASKPDETLGAQQIKTQWGSLRIQKMQRMMERGARDLFVMMAELIPSKFSHETLQEMTGVQIIPTQQDLMPIQPPPAPPQGVPPPPEYQQAAQAAQEAEQTRKAKLAQMAAVQKLLTKRLATMYRIDVESDSTIKADLSRQKAEAAEFLQAAGTYWAAVAPLIQQGDLSKEVAIEIFAANARLFNLGKSVEDVLEKMITDAKAQAANPPPPQPSPEQQKAEAEAKAREADAAAKLQQTQADVEAKKQDAETKAAASAQDMQFKREQHDMTMKEKSFDLHAKTQDHAANFKQSLVDAGFPPDYSVEGQNQMNQQQFQEIVAEMAKGRDAAAQQTEMLAKAIVQSSQATVGAVLSAVTAPKVIIKDKDGKPVGVKTVMQ